MQNTISKFTYSFAQKCDCVVEIDICEDQPRRVTFLNIYSSIAKCVDCSKVQYVFNDKSGAFELAVYRDEHFTALPRVIRNEKQLRAVVEYTSNISAKHGHTPCKWP